jgi:hypothetical protein
MSSVRGDIVKGSRYVSAQYCGGTKDVGEDSDEASGGSGISVTLNTYTHLKLDDAKEEVEKLVRAQEVAEVKIPQTRIKPRKIKIKQE